VQILQDGETCEVCLIPSDKILEFLNQQSQKGIKIDGKLWILGFSLNKLPSLLMKL